MAERRKISFAGNDNLSKKSAIEALYIGIDFGTSYSKVSFSIPALTKEDVRIFSVDWAQNDYFRPTVVYVKNNELYFDKQDGDYEAVKYFKYSIIERTLQNYTQNTKNSFEQICCIFFLANIIKRCIEKAKDIYKNNNDFEGTDIYINMGVPLENFYSEKNNDTKVGIYKTLLDCAVFLAGGSKINVSMPYDSVSISSLDEILTELRTKEPLLNYKAGVFPELVAEILLYQQSNNIPEGIYSIVDIGGGTVDMATFQKHRSSHNKSFDLFCHAQEVIPLGVEVRKSDNRDSEADLYFYKTTFFGAILDTRKHEDVSFKGMKDKKRSIDVFFLGGGNSDHWYHENIRKNIYQLSGIEMPKLNLNIDINKFIENDSTLLVKNQRLIISQMLAHHPDDISPVKAFPDYYKAAMIKNKTKFYGSFYDDINSYSDYLADLQKEKYGD